MADPLQDRLNSIADDITRLTIAAINGEIDTDASAQQIETLLELDMALRTGAIALDDLTLRWQDHSTPPLRAPDARLLATGLPTGFEGPVWAILDDGRPVDLIAAVADPDVLARAADQFGSQCIVCAIDAKTVAPGRWEIFTHGGRKPTGIDAVDFARTAAARGAGEILLTSMDRDGTRAGFNLPVTKALSDAVNVPVIASGGVGTLDHLVEGVTKGGASAVLAASIFHFGDFTISEANGHMAAAGIPMRVAA